jgi:hypothetical protein
MQAITQEEMLKAVNDYFESPSTLTRNTIVLAALALDDPKPEEAPWLGQFNFQLSFGIKSFRDRIALLLGRQIVLGLVGTTRYPMGNCHLIRPSIDVQPLRWNPRLGLRRSIKNR